MKIGLLSKGLILESEETDLSILLDRSRSEAETLQKISYIESFLRLYIETCKENISIVIDINDIVDFYVASQGIKSFNIPIKAFFNGKDVTYLLKLSMAIDGK